MEPVADDKFYRDDKNEICPFTYIHNPYTLDLTLIDESSIDVIHKLFTRIGCEAKYLNWCP